MKKILTTFFVLVFMSASSYAQSDKNAKTHKIQENMKGGYTLATVCVNQSNTYLSGKLKFVVVKTGFKGDAGSVSIVQMFKEENGKSLPVYC